MNDNYLNKAVSNLNTAKILKSNINNDDELQFNIIAFHLSQSIELAIKYILEMHRIEYDKVDDIYTLIKKANSNRVNLYLTDYIDKNCLMFTEWNDKAMYYKGYLVEKIKIDGAIEEVENYLMNVKTNIDKKKQK